MKRKKSLTLAGSISLILVLAALIVAAVPIPATAGEKPIELRFGIFCPTTDSKYYRGLEPWAKMVEKATKARVKVTLYPGGALAGSRQIYDALISGIADIGWFVTPHYPKRFSVTDIFTIPGKNIRNAKMASYVIWNLYKKFPEIQADFADVKVLFMWGFAPRSIGAKVPIRTVADLKGQKIRAMAGGESEILKAAGAVPMMFAPGDIYLNLQKGVVDAITIGWSGHVAFGVTELANYFTMINFAGPPLVVAMNKKKWNSLPADLQKAIMSVSGDVASRMCAEGDDKTSHDVMDKIRGMKGREIITFTPKEQAKWEEVAKPTQKRMLAAMEAKGLPARKVWDEIFRLVKEYKE